MFDEIPDVVLLKDEAGNFLLCNQTVARLYGTTPDEMIGKHDDDFGVPTDMADGFRANVMAIMASGQTAGRARRRAAAHDGLQGLSALRAAGDADAAGVESVEGGCGNLSRPLT
ncbi:MAG TPA: PAS domain-containing protein [Rubrivivax sp.]|nr:PAS domain-containing protein [Rubrivivax sp.]